MKRGLLRNKGILVAGPPLKEMIDPVSSDELQEAVRESLHEWWTPPFPSPERLQRSDYQVYAVLTMCRSLFMLEHGSVASKPEAAGWALESLGRIWVGLISAAARWRPGMEFDRLDETVGFIRFSLEKWGLSTGKTIGLPTWIQPV